METLQSGFSRATIKCHNAVIINDKDCTFVSYNKWDDKVNYSYLVNDTKHIYIAKDTDTSLITEDNYKDYEIVKYSDNCKTFYVKLSAMITVKSDCYLRTFLGCKKIINQVSIKK